ncbi:hypothetical protein OKW41_000312 [Paraburkholderia sp. UCT70]|uniref:aromatic-ring hydroxylase C-terminal domain-containing protein n=1 Tax=Paraburkholderia sp. UCT70 TaxID=2991068 RepID=UPI003D1A9435
MGGEYLMASYDNEQRPIGLRNVTEFTGNLQRMLAPRVKEPPATLFDEWRDGEQARKEFGHAYTDAMKREWFSIGIHLGYVYEGSPIIVPDGTVRPEDTVSTYSQTARPGSRAPHVWLEEGVSTLDLFGKAFVLLRFGANAPSGQRLADAAAKVGMPLTSHVIENDEAARLYETALVLVRPDGQVCWRSNAEPADADEIINVVRGATACTPG